MKTNDTHLQKCTSFRT